MTLTPASLLSPADREELDKAQAKWLEEQEKYEETHLGNFRRIYPCKNHERYDKFFHSSGSLYQETAAFKARSECARSVQPVEARVFKIHYIKCIGLITIHLLCLMQSRDAPQTGSCVLLRAPQAAARGNRSQTGATRPDAQQEERRSAS